MNVSRFVPLFRPSALKSCFSKEKTEKKKAQEVWPWKEPKGNGIIGGDPSGEGNRLCRSLLAAIK
jgi:hypothetical protein